jgi:hypothetical protein
VVVGVSALSQGVFILSTATERGPEYLFSTSACSETTCTISMERAPPNVALVSVTSTSVTNPQICFLFSRTSLSTLSTLHHSDISPEEITASRRMKKVILIEKRLKKYIISKKSNFLFLHRRS